jgi:iron complex transport system substrate-binding protein
VRGVKQPWAALLFVVVVLAGGCGDTQGADEGGVLVAERQRIVCASATHTEILYALGVADNIVATDLTSNYPAAAEDTEKLDAFNVSVETVAAFDPDLVILSYDPGDVVDGLETLGIATLLFAPPMTLDDVFGQISDLGDAVDRSEEAALLIDEMQADVAAVVAGVPVGIEMPTYYYELDPSLYTVTSDTFVGGIFAMLGLENIADAVDDGTGYPQLSAEYVLQANPDFIFLADTKSYGESLATVRERPGWGTLDAVAAGRVVELDDDIAARWGPRLVVLVTTVAEAVYG